MTIREPIVSARCELIVVPRAVLESATTSAGGGVDWPGIGPVSEELIATMPVDLWLTRLDADPSVAPWLVRGIVMPDPHLPSGQRVVGHAGGHGRPDDDGRVEAGYTVGVAHRGQGLATEAITAWFGWAHQHGGRIARLSVGEENAPSLAIADRLGLRKVDRIWDEDDQIWETVLEAALPLSAAVG